MNLKQLLKQLATEASALAAKAQDGTLTDEEAARADQVATEWAETKAKIDRMDAAAKAMGSISAVEVQEPETPGAPEFTGKSIGERFVASATYKAFGEQFRHGIPDGTPVSIKTAVTQKADPDPLNRAGMGVDRHQPKFTDDLVYRPPLALLDLIYVGTTSESFLPYRQVISKTNNATIVAEAKTTTGTDAAGGLKPLSTLTTQPADAKTATYADGMEVTNAELRDDGAIRGLIDSTLTENLWIAVENMLINGSGTGLEPKGILNTTGVLQQAFVTDVATTLRKAKTALWNTGTAIQAVLMNPEDDEAWDLMKDSTGRYLGNGPFGTGPETAWAVRRVPSLVVPKGQAIMGNFRHVHLLVRTALSILVFNQHKDYAQRNLNYVRAELDAMQLIRKPANLCVMDLTAD